MGESNSCIEMSLRTRLLPTVMLALAAGTAALVFRREPPASWLRVEAPAAVVPGEPYTATVVLLEPVAAAYLHFDLHGQDPRRHPLGCVAAGAPVRLTPDRARISFTLVLKDDPEIVRARAVIFLSDTGRWEDGVRTAISDLFPVVHAPSGDASRRVVSLPVHDQHNDPAIEISNPLSVRSVIASIWMLAAALWVAPRWRRAAPRARWLPVLIFLAIALCEVTAAGTWLESAGRTLARAADLYEDRRTAQQIATAGAVCAVGVLAACALRWSGRSIPSPTLLGLALYGTVALIDMVSLHDTDRMLAIAWGPVSLAAAIRATAALLALAGLARSLPVATGESPPRSQ